MIPNETSIYVKSIPSRWLLGDHPNSSPLRERVRERLVVPGATAVSATRGPVTASQDPCIEGSRARQSSGNAPSPRHGAQTPRERTNGAVRFNPDTTSDRRKGDDEKSPAMPVVPRREPSTSGATNANIQRAGDQERYFMITGRYSHGPQPGIGTTPAAYRRDRAPIRGGSPLTWPKRELRFAVSNSYSTLRDLEHPGTFEIVMLLDQEGRTNPSRMRRHLGPGPKALARALRTLTTARLICYVESKSFPFANTYELTERGKKLAATMRSWPLILGE
jgi:DNA-binding HxlR family transcriptional regulator